jgi:hypothetical protein
MEQTQRGRENGNEWTERKRKTYNMHACMGAHAELLLRTWARLELQTKYGRALISRHVSREISINRGRLFDTIPS